MQVVIFYLLREAHCLRVNLHTILHVRVFVFLYIFSILPMYDSRMWNTSILTFFLGPKSSDCKLYR
jgi:hypothetical protein